MLLLVTMMYLLIIFLGLSIAHPDKDSGASFRKRHDQRIMYAEIPALQTSTRNIC